MPDTTDQPPEDNWLWDRVQRETAAVEARLRADLGKWPLIDMLMRHFGSLLYGAAQKLIEKSRKLDYQSDQDKAVMLTCVRLFSECFAAYELARKGLVLQSIVLFRSAFEITTQGILFLEHPEDAQKWVNGQQIKPARVRELTEMPLSERALYTKLANLSHPNFEAFQYLSTYIRRDGKYGTAYLYGGWYAPKEAGQISIQLLWAQLVFLERFYARYSEELREHGLLWAGGTIDEAIQPLTWEMFLGIWRNALTELRKEHDANNPSDTLTIALEMSDFTEEEQEIFRKAFGEAQSEDAS